MIQTTYSVNNVDKVEVAIMKMGQLQDVQTENMKNLLERDAKMDSLLDKVDKLGVETKVMKTEAKEVRKSQQWLTCRMKLFMAFIGLALLYVIVAFMGCGFDFSKCT